MDSGITPDLIRCETGDWLAVSPVDAPIHLGVAAFTEEEAVGAFHAAVERRRAILRRSPRTPVGMRGDTP